MPHCARASRGVAEATAVAGGVVRGSLPPGALDRYSPDLRLDPVHVELSLVVDVPGRRLDVRQRLTLSDRAGEAHRPRELDELQERVRTLSTRVEELEARLKSSDAPSVPR